MARAFVYPPKTGDGPVVAAEDGFPADDYLAKLVKYVPAEVIAFFTPIAAFIGTDDGLIATVFVLGALGTLLWVYVSSRRVPETKRGRWYTYALSLIAYGRGLSASVSVSASCSISPTTGPASFSRVLPYWFPASTLR